MWAEVEDTGMVGGLLEDTRVILGRGRVSIGGDAM